MTRGAATNARILLVDDHEVVREGLKFLLSSARPEWEICGEAADAADAIKQAQSLKPDIILLDISMPGISGLEATPRMRKLGINCPILVFTTHQSERLYDEVRRAGAQGFVLKTQAFRDLVRAIDVLLAGGTFFGATPPTESAVKKPDTGGLSFCAGLRFAWRFQLRPLA
jgi:two-component system, NarL family, response regulator NreC